MKMPLVLIALLLSGCYSVRYDRQEFAPAEKKSFDVGKATLYLGMFSSSYDALNARNRGPWMLRIKCKGGLENNSSILIHGLKIISREGVELELPDAFELKRIELEGGGVVWESVVEESFSPAFYDEQILSAFMEVEAGGVVKEISQQFIPKRVTGRERVNLLTM